MEANQENTANNPKEVTPEEKQDSVTSGSHSNQLDADSTEESTPSYSESHEVTPPVPHEVPSIGNTKSVFENAGRHGRTSSRMIDHEPGL